MKIGFVLDDSLDKSDGVQHHILTLGEYFAGRGHEVHYLVGETHRTDIRNVHSLSKNLRVRFNQNKMSTPLPGNKKNIRQLLNNEQFDILHIQMPYSPLLAGRIIAVAPAKTKIVGTFHIVPFSRIESAASRLLAIWCRGTLQKFSTIISVSAPAQQFLSEAFDAESIVIPNPINIEHYSQGRRIPELRKQLVIVFVGRLVARKGCAYLLEAIHKLNTQDKLSNARLVICGTGPLEDDLKTYVAKHELASFVHFAGYVSEQEKLDHLASADIAVMPSTGGESFGIVLTEAMAAGADVVVAGNNAGYASVLAGKPDQLVDPSDIDAFAEKLLKFMDSPNERERAKAWQSHHVQQFDVKQVGPRILQEYESVLAKQRKN